MVFTHFLFILLCFSTQLFGEYEQVISEESDLSFFPENVELAKKTAETTE